MKKKIIYSICIITIILFYFYLFPFFPQDTEYKKELLKSAANPEYTLDNMKPIIGQDELAYILKKYDKHPEKYMTDLNEQGDLKGVDNLTYRIGLHSHTTFSDGEMTPEETLNQAAQYADRVKSKHPFERYPMIIAITDHFNTKGCIEAIDIIQHNPEKYKNLRFVIGMENETYVKLPSQKEERPIHILVWCINPYEFPFKNLSFDEAWNNWKITYKEIIFLPDYKEYIKLLNSLRYGLISIAHPLRYFDKDETIFNVINELFSEFKELKIKKEIFTEAYYQPYRFDIESDVYNYASETAHKNNIIRTGSQDSHGKSIFSCY